MSIFSRKLRAFGGARVWKCAAESAVEIMNRRRLAMVRPRIRITLVDRKGSQGCHRGHRIGDSFDFDSERGKLCPMAMHVAFPYVDILRYGGSLPGRPAGTALFCCPDVDVINVFKIEIVE